MIDGVTTTVLGLSPAKFQDNQVKGFALELAAAFALTVHKAQGISADEVVIPPLPPLKSAARGQKAAATTTKTNADHGDDGDGGGDDEARKEINSERVSTFYSTVRCLTRETREWTALSLPHQSDARVVATKVAPLGRPGVYLIDFHVHRAKFVEAPAFSSGAEISQRKFRSLVALVHG